VATASRAAPGLLVIYDLSIATEQRLSGHREWTFKLAVSPRGHVFVSGGEDQVVGLWEVASGWRVRELRGRCAPSKH
jgi:WD40 repeat protein